MLIDDIERLERANEKLEQTHHSTLEKLNGLADKYHAADKQCAVLDERFKVKKSIEVINGTCIAVGGLVGGYGFSIVQSQSGIGWTCIGIGAVLILAGAIAKAVKL